MADGRVVIDTDLDNKGFIAKSKEMIAAISSLQRATLKIGNDIRRSAGGFGTAMRQNADATRVFSTNAEKAASSIGQMEKELNRMGRTRVDTAEYAKVRDEINKTTDALNTYRAKQEELIKSGANQASAKWTKNESAIADTTEKLEKAKAVLAELQEYRTELNSESSYDEALSGGPEAWAEYKNSVTQVNNEIQQNITWINEMESSLERMQEKRIAMQRAGDDKGTRQWQTLQSDIQEAENALDSLQRKKEALELFDGDTQAYEVTEEYQNLSTILDRIKGQYSEMLLAGQRALTSPDLVAWENMKTMSGMVAEGLGRIQYAASMVGRTIAHPFQALDRALGFIATKAINAASSLAKMAGNAALSYLKRLATNARNAAIQLAKIAGNAIATGIRNIGSMAADGAKKLLGLGRSAKQSGRGFKFSLFNLIKYGFGVRSVFVLVNRLRKALTDAFGVLAKKFPSFNKAMSQMVTALNRLKNSFGAAFAPIVTAAAPYITKFLNMLSDAMTRLGMFIAMLTGQKYYYQATAVQEDYAKSLDKTASSNKKAAKAQEEANRQLASFDELNILSDKDNSNTSPTSDTSGAGLTQVPVSSITGWIAELKKAFEAGDFDEIGKVIAEKINEIFTKVDNLIKWDNVGATITKYIDAFTGVVNSMVDNINWDLIGKTVGDGIDTVINSFYQLATDVDWADIGTGIGTALNGLLYSVDWGKLGETVSAWLRGRFTTIRDAAATFSWGDAGTSFANAVNGLFDQKTFDELSDALYTGVTGAFEAFVSFVGNWEWGNVADMFGRAVNDLFDIIDAIKFGDTLRKAIGVAIGMMKTALTKIDFADAGDVLAKQLNNFFDPEVGDNIFAEAGETINEAIEDLLDFGQIFLNTFNEENLAEDIKSFLRNVKWRSIVEEAWDLLGKAVAKAGNFLTVLLGGQSSRKAYLDVDTMWERQSAPLSEQSAILKWTYDWDALAKNMATALSDALKKVLDLATEIVNCFDAKTFGEKIKAFLDADTIDWPGIAQKIWDFLKAALLKVIDLGGLLSDLYFGDMPDDYSTLEKWADSLTMGAYGEITGRDKNGFEHSQLGRLLKGVETFFSPVAAEPLENGVGSWKPTVETIEDVEIEEATINAKGKTTPKISKTEDENTIPMIIGSLFSSSAHAEESELMIKRINDVTKNFAKSFKSTVNESQSAISTIYKNVSAGLGNLNSNAVSKMTSFKNAIVSKTNEANKGASKNVTDLYDTVELKLYSLANDASNYARIFKERGIESSNDIKNASSDALNYVGTNTVGTVNLIRGTVSSAMSNITSSVNTSTNTISNLARNAGANMTSSFSNAGNAMESSISYAFSSIASRDWYGLGNLISNGVTNAGYGILYYDWDYIGAATMWGVQRGIDREAQYLYNQVRNIGYNLGRMMANVLRIGSPSKVFEYQGEMIGAGLSIGIESSGKESISVTEKVGQKIAEALNSIKAIDAIKNGLGIHTDASTYRTPQIATGTVMPYAIAAEAELTDADVLTEAIETSNDDLASVIIQAFNNATATIVQAIRENGGKGQSLDRRTLANAVIDEINQRTRAQGKSPLLI